MNDKKIAADIYEDGFCFQIPDLINEFWVGIDMQGSTIGCYRLHQMGAILWQIHAMILPKFRKEFSLDASTLVLRWAAHNIEDLERVVCFVPKIHSNVAVHAKTVGLIHEGTIKDSFLRKSKIVDQEIYGIGRKEIELL